jgi:acetyl-CoA C-acetyltransferase
VFVGVGLESGAQSVSQAARHPSDAIDLMARAVRTAADDTGVSAILEHVDVTAVVGGLWRFRDPAALIAERVGFRPGRTLLTEMGGQVPGQLCHDLADRIQAGRIDVGLIIGGECNATRRALSRGGSRPASPSESSDGPDERWGAPLIMGDAQAVARGADLPRNTYAILDSALRFEHGETLDEARERAALICAGYSSVAATNPHAASRHPMTAAEIREPSRTNRMVSWPYTKAMCANNTVDHAGALILCSARLADRLGIGDDRRVYAHAFSLAFDTETLVDRYELAQAPGLEAATAAVLELQGGIDKIDHLDLYCCYPSMVTLTAEALGVPLDRPLTVTGGLGFAGAPINFAAGEGLIAMVEKLRSDPGSTGLVQANGGIASKHSFGLLSSNAPVDGCRFVVDRRTSPTRPVASGEASGVAIVDGVTVEYSQDGPQRAIALARFDNGSRCWSNAFDLATMNSIIEEEWVGREVRVSDGQFRAFD